MTDQTPTDPFSEIALYLILPAYNEERNIRQVLATFCSAFPNTPFRFHVVVNNSKDKTYEQALTEAAIDRRIIVTNIAEKIGKGGAILYGFEQAKDSSHIGFIDTDGSITPEAVSLLLKAFVQNPSLDIAISSRWLAESRLTKKQTFIRRLSSRSFNLVSRILFGFPYRDTQCGAKIMRLEAWKKISSKVQDRSFAFDVDLLWQAKKMGLKVSEVPIPWHDTPGSSVNISRSAWPIIVSLFRIRFRSD